MRDSRWNTRLSPIAGSNRREILRSSDACLRFPKPAERAPGGICFIDFDVGVLTSSAALDVDAWQVQFHAGSSIPALVVVALTVDPLVHHLVPVMLVHAPGPADVLAAHFTTYAVDRLRDAELLRRAAQAGCARRGSGIGL